MTDIFDKVLEHFKSKSDYVSTFVKYQSLEEWWFGAEITWLLDRMNVKFDREKEYLPDKYVDFVLYLGGEQHFIEMKALLNGPSRFLKNINADYQKLVAWQKGQRWLLMIAYPFSKEQWQTWFSQSAGAFPHAEQTKVTDFSIAESQKCTIVIWRIL